MWKFCPGHDREADEFIAKLKGLETQIDVIRSLTVGKTVSADGSADAALIAEFDNKNDLELYKNDPRHKAVSGLCKSIRQARYCVDLEV